MRFASLLKGEDMPMEAVTSPDAALRAMRRGRFDLLLMDLNYTGDTTSGREGIDLLARVQSLDDLLPIVVMTGWGSVDLAVEAMRRGVRDFVQKPWDNRQLVAMLRVEIEAGRRGAGAQQQQERELQEARRIQRKLLPAAHAGRSTAGRSPPRGSRQPASAETATTPSRSDARASALSIADVVGKGIPAALLMSNLQAPCGPSPPKRAQPGGALPPGQSRALRQHRRRPLHQLLLLRRRLARAAADVSQRRALSADPDARGRLDRAADSRRSRARGVSATAATRSDRCRSAPAIA